MVSLKVRNNLQLHLLNLNNNNMKIFTDLKDVWDTNESIKVIVKRAYKITFNK